MICINTHTHTIRWFRGECYLPPSQSSAQEAGTRFHYHDQNYRPPFHPHQELPGEEVYLVRGGGRGKEFLTQNYHLSITSNLCRSVKSREFHFQVHFCNQKTRIVSCQRWNYIWLHELIKYSYKFQVYNHWRQRSKIWHIKFQDALIHLLL